MKTNSKIAQKNTGLKKTKIGYRGLRNLTLRQNFFLLKNLTMSKTVERALGFFNLHCCKVSKQVYRKCKKDCAHRNQKGNSLRMYGPGYRWACRKGEGGVDTLQAAELPYSVNNGPVKKNENLGRQSKQKNSEIIFQDTADMIRCNT